MVNEDTKYFKKTKNEGELQSVRRQETLRNNISHKCCMLKGKIFEHTEIYTKFNIVTTIVELSGQLIPVPEPSNLISCPPSDAATETTRVTIKDGSLVTENSPTIMRAK